MNEQERLEKIKKRVSNMPGMPTKIITWQGWKPVITLFEDDYKYLFQHAEEKIKLQDENKLLKESVSGWVKQYDELLERAEGLEDIIELMQKTWRPIEV